MSRPESTRALLAASTTVTPNSSMLADFAVRLALGLSIATAAADWRATPPTFFRTNCQVVLGLLVLAAMAIWQIGGGSPACWTLAGAAGAAYAATVAWGLGLVRVGRPALWLISVVAAGWLAAASREAALGLWLFNAASRWASGFVLGAAVAAMLLGHHYLTAPATSIEPLKRYVRFMGWGLAVRGALALGGLWLAHGAAPALGFGAAADDSWLFPLMRWGMGFAAPVLATAMAWKTVEIRSTQAATGILYATTTLLLFGELTSLIVARGGVPIV